MNKNCDFLSAYALNWIGNVIWLALCHDGGQRLRGFLVNIWAWVATHPVRRVSFQKNCNIQHRSHIIIGLCLLYPFIEQSTENHLYSSIYEGMIDLRTKLTSVSNKLLAVGKIFVHPYN